jgi:pyruvate formate lyase activating enzyme
MDAANVDLKGFTERSYRQVCGGHLQPVLDTLVYLKRETDVWFELTTLLIPGENDSDSELDALTAWVVAQLGPDVPLHFTAFHPDWRMQDRPPTPAATLRRAREIARRNGVRYAYTGNVRDPAGDSTYCAACGAVAIGRDWYQLTTRGLRDDGRCAACGARCPGVFDAQPGAWGPRRPPAAPPVRLPVAGRARVAPMAGFCISAPPVHRCIGMRLLSSGATRPYRDHTCYSEATGAA